MPGLPPWTEFGPDATSPGCCAAAARTRSLLVDIFATIFNDKTRAVRSGDVFATIFAAIRSLLCGRSARPETPCSQIGKLFVLVLQMVSATTFAEKRRIGDRRRLIKNLAVVRRIEVPKRRQMINGGRIRSPYVTSRNP